MAVIRGRMAILSGIALMLFVAPSVVQAVVDAVAGQSMAGKLAGGIVGLIAFFAALIGSLAVTSVATDPGVDRSAALAIAGQRIGPMLGVGIVLGLVFLVSMVPGIVLIGVSGIPFDQTQQFSRENVDLGKLAFSVLYFILLGAVWFWAFARLLPLAGVIVNERRGLGAIGRAFALTRGSAMKLVGVLILYSIVMLVVLMATFAVFGLVARLGAGDSSPGTVIFVASIAVSLVTAAFSVIQAVFAGQFYVAACDLADPSKTFE